MVKDCCNENMRAGEFASPSGAKVKVIDSIMGAGKSTWARQYMREHPDEHYVYCTPFLSEIDKTIELCPECYMTQPDNRRGKRKIDDLNDLLFQGRNVACSHVCFASATEKTIDAIQSGGYSLILDETLDVLVDFNEAYSDRITKKDIKLLLEKGFIHIDQYNKVEWATDSYIGSQYSNVEVAAKNGNLYLINGVMLTWVFPPAIFSAFENVFLLTYQFRGSYLRPYFEYYRIPYELVGVEQLPSGKYQLCQYKSDIALRTRYRDLIAIYDDPKMNRYDNFSLSATDYRRMTSKKDSQRLKELKNGLYNYFHNVCKTKGNEVMWTSPKIARGELKGKGYCGRELTREEIDLPLEQRSEIIGQKTCFVPCNARGYNEFRNKTVLAYLLNFYAKPGIKDFYEAKNRIDGTNIKIDEDMLALSYMLQWIWRSAIRNGKPIRIWIPSTRMRNLLIHWLNGDEITAPQGNANAALAVRAA